MKEEVALVAERDNLKEKEVEVAMVLVLMNCDDVVTYLNFMNLIDQRFIYSYIPLINILNLLPKLK